MISRDETPNSGSEIDHVFDDLVCAVSARLEAGETIDLDVVAVKYPNHVERLAQILPTLQAMAELGQSGSSINAAPRQTDLNKDQEIGTVGDYRIVHELGRGGMGVVYEAEQISVGRHVALKILPFAALLNETQLRRFNTEATAAARLHHPNIVQVYSVGCERGIHYYAMQLIEGPSLSEVIAELRQDRPLSDEQDTADSNVLTLDEDGGHYRAVARIGKEAAEALQYAHDNGVLHRDCKPSNLLLDKTGHVWIADFGLARVEDESQLTRTGDILGTLRYMSPEQAKGERVDVRSDVYSLGATLFELATLQPVYDAEDRRDIIKQVLAGDPTAPHIVDSRIPTPLSLVICKSMARLDQRYQSAQELADDLQRFLDGEPVSAKRPTLLRRSKAWARRHRMASAAIVGLLILVLLSPIFSPHLFQRVTDDSPTKGQDMKVSKTAKVVAAAAAVAIVATTVNAKKPPKPPPGEEVPNPTGLVVSAATEDSITLEWTSGGGTTAGFLVAYLEGTRYPKSNLRGATVIEVGDVESYTVPDESDDPFLTDQTYSFRVCAVDSNGKRSSGVTVQGTTLSAPPVLYEVFDHYAQFEDGPTYLNKWYYGEGSFAVQPDGKVLVLARAAPEPALGTTGDHFICRMNPDGTADPTFNGSGFHRMDILNDGDLSFDFPHSVIVLLDELGETEKILVVGTTGGVEFFNCNSWYLVQYNADGILDNDPETGFGERGIVIDSVDGVRAHKFGGAVRPDGRIVIAGDTDLGFTIAQYNPDGSPDADFGLDGGMTSFLPAGVRICGASGVVAILSNGKTAVVGRCDRLDDRIVSSVVMFNQNGTVDQNFGDDGFAYVETWPDSGTGPIGWEWFTCIVEQDDGKLLAGGQRGGYLDDGEWEWSYVRTLARFKSDGTIDDENFGVNGVVIPQRLGDGFEEFASLALQDDQKIVALGFKNEADYYANDIFVERFNVDGSRDLSFDGTGRIEFSTQGNEVAHGLQILGTENAFDLPSGTIVIGGVHTRWEPDILSRGLLLYLVPMP